MQEKEVQKASEQKISEQSVRPLEVRIRDAKLGILTATYEAMTKYLLPAYLVEELVTGVLADVRGHKYEALLMSQETEKKDVK